VMFCLSKGLGAPVGSILAGPEAFVDRARRHRKLFGGGMRQAGVIAAPGLVALENVDRLAEDHENAALIAEKLDGVGGLATNDPDTNIVLVDVTGAGTTADEFTDACEREGVLATSVDADTARLVTHLDVSRDEVETAIDRIRTIVG